MAFFIPLKETMTKDEILNVLGEFSQEKIFAKYLNTEVSEIIALSETEDIINSPLRVDKNPSFGFQRQNNPNKYDKRPYILRARDFVSNHYNHGIYFWGDCFDLVRHYLERNPEAVAKASFTEPTKEKEWFMVILKHITYAFGIDIFGDVSQDIEIVSSKEKEYVEKIGRIRKQFEPRFRDWNDFDRKYWGDLGVTRDQLERKKVAPCNEIWIWSDQRQSWQLVFLHRDNDICYCYDYGLDEKGIRMYKFYFVLRKRHESRHRFMTNLDRFPFLDNKYLDLEITQITRIGCVIKATKDALVGANFKLFNEEVQFYEAPAEGILPKPHEAFEINIRHDLVLIFYDYDYAGISAANYCRRKYNWIPIFITNGRFKTINFGAKDLSDLKRLGYNINILAERLEAYLEPLLKNLYNYYLTNLYYGKD